MAVATAMVMAGCSDGGVTGPSASVEVVESKSSNLLGLLGGLLGLQQAAPITRNVALPSDISWSFTVGSGGATSSNTASGMTIRVPAGALSAPTTITVTALQGMSVAYRFEPHGLQFSRKVLLTQRLNGTSAASELFPSLRGAYFSTDEPIISDGLALVSEVIAGLLNPLAKSFSFGIEHFSGYIVVSGRGSRAD